MRNYYFYCWVALVLVLSLCSSNAICDENGWQPFGPTPDGAPGITPYLLPSLPSIPNPCPGAYNMINPYLYHVTSPANVPSIMESGLQPGSGIDPATYQLKQNWFSRTPVKAEGTVLKVRRGNIPGIRGYPERPGIYSNPSPVSPQNLEVAGSIDGNGNFKSCAPKPAARAKPVGDAPKGSRLVAGLALGLEAGSQLVSGPPSADLGPFPNPYSCGVAMGIEFLNPGLSTRQANSNAKNRACEKLINQLKYYNATKTCPFVARRDCASWASDARMAIEQGNCSKAGL